MYQILLVDDDVNFRRSLMIQLELEGYSVLCEESGSQAIENLKNLKNRDQMPGIVISDIRMPDMNGIEFVREAKHLCPGLPVLVISAFDPPEALAVHPFLRKPFKLNDIVQHIDHLIG